MPRRAAALGRRVVVVGGGSAALDAGAQRAPPGHAVTLLALERERRCRRSATRSTRRWKKASTLVDGAMLRVQEAVTRGQGGRR
jgi:cation diffusion facilitator CzcD-associated flavoprotein CzcO